MLKRRFEIEETDNKIVKFSWSTDQATGYIDCERDFKELHKVVSAQGNYSSSCFREGHRIKENWKSGNNLLILDIDEDWTIQDAVEFLSNEGLEALIATTRSHQKEKNGIIRDRFRILIPANEFVGTPEDFSNAMINIHKYFNGIPDPACKDVARMYYGNPNCEYYYVDGDSLDWNEFKFKKENKTVLINNKNKDVFECIDKFLKNIGGLQEGNRNNTLYRIGKWAKGEGKSQSEVIQMINDYNSKSYHPLEEREINNLVKNL
jgi:hypothetical protein